MGEDPREGTLLGDRYRIGERLASGGMGAVYRGTQIALDREVAIKFLHGWMAFDVRARRRFEVEAQAMAKLRHPHCAQVLDFGLDGDTPYLVMELVEGETLGEILDRGPLSPGRAVTIARQAASALAHAHDRGITHRDIKPDNLMIGEATAVGDHVRILDFGIARLAEDGGALTAGMAIGTPKYMAPEQATGAGSDHRADLYAIAIVLYEMLAGEPPFVADETVEVLRMHREAPPPRLADKAPHAAISAELEEVLSRALAKTPDARFPDALALSDALAACPEALSPGPSPRPQSRPTPEHAAPAPPTPAEGHSGPARAPPGGHPAGPIVPQTGQAPPHPAPATGTVTPALPAPPVDRPGWVRRNPAVAIGIAAIGFLVIVVAALPDSSEADGNGPGAATDDRDRAAAAEGPPLARRLAGARELVADDPGRGAIRRLEALVDDHGDVAEAHFLLGRAYFANMWWTDGLEAFARAIELDESYRTDPTLIETALEGFISRRAHERIASFLADEVGPAARPHLEELAGESESQRVRERAAAALERF